MKNKTTSKWKKYLQEMKEIYINNRKENKNLYKTEGENIEKEYKEEKKRINVYMKREKETEKIMKGKNVYKEEEE